MSNIANNSSQIAWLLANLAIRRNRLLSLIQRLTGLGSAGALAPQLYARFTCWLDEVATLKRDEMRIMERIEDVEREHRLMRHANKLRRAGPPLTITEDCPYQEHYKPRKPGQSVVLLITLWYLFVRQRINHKKQGLTVD